MPTAVMTESSENTASNSTICVTTTEKLAQTRGPLWVWLTPSRRSCSSVVALNSRNRPPTSKMSERPEKSSVPIENSGVVSVTNHETMDSSPRRMSRAKVRPMTRARSRCSGGSLSAKMAMKTRLSTPRTISSTIRVKSPNQIEGSDTQARLSASMRGLLPRG